VLLDRERHGHPLILPQRSDKTSTVGMDAVSLTAKYRVVSRRASRIPSRRIGRHSFMERKKAGRPPRGVRKMAAYKLPVALLEAMSRHAAEHGMTVTDLVGEALADRVGVPYMPQEGLPLNKAS
jgi:hypothetical protein